MRIFSKTALLGVVLGLILTAHASLPGPDAAYGNTPIISNCVQFIYIDANVGGSSGGHSALRIDNTVYHFQYYSDGIFRLVRESWPHFRYIYNDLENRTLYVAHMDIENSDLETLQAYLDRHYLIREAHMARFAALSADIRLLDDLSSGRKEIPIGGAGLFSFEDPPDAAGIALRSMVNGAYGEGYLESKKEALNKRLSEIPVAATNVASIPISGDIYPSPIVTLSTKYSENRLKWMGLNVLGQAFPLGNTVINDMDLLLRPGDPRGLTPNERSKLKDYAENLGKSVIELPSSQRPDWGFSILLANARYQAIMRSLEYNRLCLLDPFPESAGTVPAGTQRGDPTVTAKLADRAWEKYWDIRRSVFEKERLDERSFSRLEESAGRFKELEKGNQKGRAIRIAYGRLIPCRSAMVPLYTLKLSKRDLNRSLIEARLNRRIYNDRLKQCYPYHLINRNCATELIRHINIPFENQKRVTEALGGTILADKYLSFIPSRLFGLVKNRLRITKTEVLPGYRKRMLYRSAQNNRNQARIYFRECNTITSTLYRGGNGDTPFLFFTDDVIWIRPLYGALNGVYGLLTAALGLFTLPLDGGERSLSGLKGTLYSLPEIFFFNIRKGSFDYVDGPTGTERALPMVAD